MQSQAGTGGFPARRAAAAFRIRRDDEALEAAPADAQPEQPQAVEHGVDTRLGDGLEDHAEQPAGAAEIPLPERVAARTLQRREDDLVDLGPVAQPARDRERATGMPLEADAERAQTAQRQKAIVAARADTHVRPQAMQLRVRLGVAG